MFQRVGEQFQVVEGCGANLVAWRLVQFYLNRDVGKLPIQRFAFELDGLPPGEKASGATLRLTAISGDKAIEVAFRLD